MIGQQSFLRFAGDRICVALPRARTTDPETSHLAAGRLGHADAHCAQLLRVYAAHSGGLTDNEAEAISGIEHAWKRCSDLRRVGLIVPITTPDGKLVTRPGPTGRAQMVCMVTK